RSARSNFTVIISILVGSICIGCDGIYRYRYAGQISAADLGDRQLEVAVGWDEGGTNHGQSVAVGPDGRFNGEFVRLTGWVFALRPPAPKYDKVYLTQWEAGNLVGVRAVPVKEQDKTDSMGRDLNLGVLEWK
ncbi:MAG TPA: hypothetical protein PK402_01815, partial [Tepidisphaeraceae bacterium]|nr:hypothetical protein [Tepidisphaeraceae bacterium]